MKFFLMFAMLAALLFTPAGLIEAGTCGCGAPAPVVAVKTCCRVKTVTRCRVKKRTRCCYAMYEHCTCVGKCRCGKF